MSTPRRREGKLEEYPQIVRAITGTPWLIVPENLKAILDIVNMRLNGDAFSDEEIEMRLKAARNEAESEHDNPRVQSDGGVGVVSLYGPIFPKANLMTMLSGATSLDMFTKDMRALMPDDKVKQIVIDFNTPGGTSDMVEETGDLIRQMKETKPIYGIANTGANSAGYWLLSQCTKAYATPSGQVGSIGVYTTHEDTSAQDAKLGRKITVVSAGESKTLLNPHEPLSEEGKAYLKEGVQEIYDDFVSVVAKGRNVSKEHVLENFGGGKVFSARKAKSLGMIDDVMSMNDLLGSLVEDNYSSRAVSVKGDLAHHVSRMQEMLTSSDDKTAFGAANFIMNKALSTVEVVDESKEWEHSEPGTGNPPQPITKEDGSDDVAIRERWRRDSPPIAKPEEVQDASVSTSYVHISTKGGSTVAELTEKDLRELLKVADVDDEGKLVESIKLMRGELDEFRRNQDLASQEKEFSVKYPEVWNEHNKLMAKTRKQDAKTFVESISRVRKAQGNGLTETKMGLSTVAREKIEEVHLLFAEGNATTEEFEACIKTLMNGGLLEFGEIGSRKDGEDDLPEIENNSASGIAGNKKLFNEVIVKIQKEHPELTFQEAYAKAAEKHPDLAQASRIALPA